MSSQRIPLAFVDKTGFVTPFNGRIDMTLAGWYLYTKEDVDLAKQQQARLENERVTGGLNVSVTQYSISDVEAESVSGRNQLGDDTPEWIYNVLPKDNTAPFLQIGKDGQTQAAEQVVVKPMTAGQFHDSSKPGHNLTPEQLAEVVGNQQSAAKLVADALGN